RGANSVESNTRESIMEATALLMTELLSRNELAPEQLVSCIFTVTDDLDAEFPALAARTIGLNAVPLICAREVPVPGALPRVVRVLVHYHAGEDHQPRHVYLGEARLLRSDLDSAQ